MAFDDKIEYDQAGTVLTMHCDDGSVKVFDRKVVMPALRWRSDPEYVWELRTVAQYPKVTVTPRQRIDMVLIDDPLKVQCVDPHKFEVAVAWARSRGWCGKIVWDPHMNANDCKDNAARKWYYETQVQPRWKKESKS